LNAVFDYTFQYASPAKNAEILDGAYFSRPTIEGVGRTYFDAEFSLSPFACFHIDSYASLFEVLLTPTD